MMINKKWKSIISVFLTLCIMATFIPAAFAAQSNDYVDPVDVWLSSNNRTNELDVNATTTYETSYCAVCEKDTYGITYRVPEYTKSGETAMNRGVMYSDGTLIGGEGSGNLDDGTPGIDAYYTGYHFTKSICQTCGTINSLEGPGVYNFNRNVYALYSCDHNFFLDFDNTTYEPHDEETHLTTLKRGEYCKFCKGTFSRAAEGLEEHNFDETVDAQIGNNRFYITDTCEECAYKNTEYVTAKSVVASYYGTADGEAHTLTVSDLSDRGVKTSILYGDSADNCTKTSAPNYTKEGYYTVYYQINYSYAGETMTENGVSYVWLVADEKEDNDSDDTIVVLPMPHEHEFHYLETVKASCTELGYERFQCSGCGELEKRNYIPALGHSYEDIVIREATCKQGGLVLTQCKSCGDFHQETTATGAHDYRTENHNPTCQTVGYTDHICEVCSHSYITDITPLISHAYERITKAPTCTDKGYTASTCTMCGMNTVSDYTEPTGHDWNEGETVTSSTCNAEGVMEYTCQSCGETMIQAISANGHSAGTAATCTTPQLCEVCGTVLENARGHSYDIETVEPTCIAMGYSVYTCAACGDTYNSDYIDKTEHDYNKIVTEPTCTSHGFTTYSCVSCGDKYISDYTDKKAHNYNAVVTNPTCTEMGYTTYTCKDCGSSYVGDYTDMVEHNYNKEIVEPTCTEHGYAVYTCPDCGKSYIGDYTDDKEHHYTETVVAPTCTEMGYSVFKCDDCGDEYKDKYTDKLPHTYDKTVTEPTCLELGFTTFVCSVCGDTYKGEYKEATGHTPSDWIVDVPATIEQAGEKHIECSVCGIVLRTAAIPQLIDTDHSDEDGNAEVGAFSIILTDKENKPVFDSEITIDTENNITIKLPEERLLDFEDQTTITAFFTDTQAPAADLQIFIYDRNNNAATGKTNADGQLKVPNSQSSTGDNNGTIGGEDEESKFTYVVTVTNKENLITENCDIWIGESNNIVVDLPDGVKPTREEPVIVTVTDQNGEAKADVTVIVLGDADFIEKGVTDIYGKVTLPITNEGYTDENGKVNVDNMYVVINDELGFISNAYVKHNEDGSIIVTLPEEKTIGYDNRTTVTVLDSMGNPMPKISVTVNDHAEKTYTAATDENGKMVVPPLSEDMTDSEGKAKVNGYHIWIADEAKPIENAFVTMADGKIHVALPEGSLIAIENRITATVTDSENAPVKGVSVTFTDTAEKTETNVTDENGKATVPPTNIDLTDGNGYGEVSGFTVTVKNEAGFIEKAFITYHAEVKNEDDTVKTAENISVLLPETVFFSYDNRISVTVANKADGAPVQGMNVIVSETEIKAENSGKEQTEENTETTETPVAKTLSGLTDRNGIVVLPPLSEDMTDEDGTSDVTETQPSEDEESEDKTVTHHVSVADTKGNIHNAFIQIADGKVFITLPETHALTTANQTTATITNEKGEPVKGVSVTIKDKTTSKSGTTDANGKVTLPVKSSGGGGGSRPSGGGGSLGGGSYVSTTITVTDKDGKNVSVTKSVAADKATLTLPAGKNLAKGNTYYTITVKSGGKAKADYTVVLKDRNGNEATGKTDDSGMLILPAKEHKAYIVGYEDGTFRADSDMTRAEAAAIFARMIAEEKGERISGKSTFADVKSGEWYASYIAYLEKYNVIKGYADGTFRPDAPVTRAEFVAMAVRYYGIFNDVQKTGCTVKYTDVEKSYWAYDDIAYAKNIGWLNGYADGTFKGDNNITRAEVVTVVNRATGRMADEDYVSKNTAILNKFTDLNKNHWSYLDVMEAANTHLGVAFDDSETWVK